MNNELRNLAIGSYLSATVLVQLLFLLLATGAAVHLILKVPTVISKPAAVILTGVAAEIGVIVVALICERTGSRLLHPDKK